MRSQDSELLVSERELDNWMVFGKIMYYSRGEALKLGFDYYGDGRKKIRMYKLLNR